MRNDVPHAVIDTAEIIIVLLLVLAYFKFVV
jgi:hypothetical protein